MICFRQRMELMPRLILSAASGITFSPRYNILHLNTSSPKYYILHLNTSSPKYNILHLNTFSPKYNILHLNTSSPKYYILQFTFSPRSCILHLHFHQGPVSCIFIFKRFHQNTFSNLGLCEQSPICACLAK